MKEKQKKKPASTSLVKILPSCVDAEQAVLAAIIKNERLLDEMGFLRSFMFYDDRYAQLFDIIWNMNRQQKPIDVISVNVEIMAAGKQEMLTPYFVAETCAAVITTAYALQHALFVKEKYIQRKAVESGQIIVDQAYDQQEDIADVLFRAGNEIDALQEELVGNNGIKSMADVSEAALLEIDKRIAKYAGGQQSGVATGLRDLDQITCGWQPSELVVVAARPAMGKTALSLHFAKHAALSGVPVALFSLEMSDTSLYNRLLLSEAEINSLHLKSGNLSPEELSKIDVAARSLWSLPIYVDDTSNVSMPHIHSRCRLLKKKGKCGMVIIDYLQLASESGAYNRNREQEITMMSRQAKIIAKELEVPVILLSQLNRDVEKRTDKKPLLSDLRESGAIEQDADMVIFIHRPEYYGIEVKDKNTGEPVKNYGELIVAKYRNGATGTVGFRHDGALTRIFDYAR